jgi:sensor domain CHASE-containing protein
MVQNALRMFSEVEASFVDVPDMQEDQILHDAAKVLRGSLHAVEISKDLYPSSSDLSHHRSLQFIPPSLKALSVIWQ